MRLLEADEEVKISYITLSKVNNTLLELYLQQAHTAADRETGAAETAEKKGSGEGDEEDELSQEVAVAKAMQLVEQHHDTKIDLDRALVLCQQYDFPAGALHLLEIQHSESPPSPPPPLLSPALCRAFHDVNCCSVCR